MGKRQNSTRDNIKVPPWAVVKGGPTNIDFMIFGTSTHVENSIGAWESLKQLS